MLRNKSNRCVNCNEPLKKIEPDFYQCINGCGSFFDVEDIEEVNIYE